MRHGDATCQHTRSSTRRSPPCNAAWATLPSCSSRAPTVATRATLRPPTIAPATRRTTTSTTGPSSRHVATSPHSVDEASETDRHKGVLEERGGGAKHKTPQKSTAREGAVRAPLREGNAVISQTQGRACPANMWESRYVSTRQSTEGGGGAVCSWRGCSPHHANVCNGRRERKNTKQETATLKSTVEIVVAEAEANRVVVVSVSVKGR